LSRKRYNFAVVFQKKIKIIARLSGQGLGWDSLTCIATLSKLKSWGVPVAVRTSDFHFSTLTLPALWPTQPRLQWILSLFSGSMAAKEWLCTPTTI
jgi:hypothetical protein